jgi:NADPH2:quinone reductase
VKAKAIRVHEHGGPEVLKLEETELRAPGPGEAAVRIEAVGVNFIDVYHRTGLYPNPLPFTPGLEAAGVVTAVGDGVLELRAGDRVACSDQLGAYAEAAVVKAERLVRVPSALTASDAAAAMLQGMTAHYLSHDTYPLKAGDACLVHAAAGGVGLLLVQMARRAGARVLATVGSEQKETLARDAGADEVIRYDRVDVATEVRRLTEGRGVKVVYDSVGRDTFDGSLASLSPRGMLVLFGQSSGTVPPFNPGLLASKGSLYLTRPSLFHYVADAPSLRTRSSIVLGWIASGELRLRIGATFPLADAADAHRALEGRRTTGKVLLIP